MTAGTLFKLYDDDGEQSSFGCDFSGTETNCSGPVASHLAGFVC